MIHNLTAKPAQVYINYDDRLRAADRPPRRRITPVHPIWMDVEDHHIYPVFNVRSTAASTGSSRSPTWPRTRTATQIPDAPPSR